MNLIHYSVNKIEVLDATVDYSGLSMQRFKPRGLWVSVDDAWEVWCRDEEYELARLTHKHKIKLRDTANILLLDTTEKIRAFDEQYKLNMLVEKIDWLRVKQHYDGIIIAPYQWSLRYELMWYYGWDCASGCIWNINAIKEIIHACG